MLLRFAFLYYHHPAHLLRHLLASTVPSCVWCTQDEIHLVRPLHVPSPAGRLPWHYLVSTSRHYLVLSSIIIHMYHYTPSHC